MENFDTESWQEDEGGCKGMRLPMVQSLLDQKDKLLALDELEIVEQLGRPDEHELYTRNQKFFYYDLTPGKTCPAYSEPRQRLMIRFNAMGLAKEISVE